MRRQAVPHARRTGHRCHGPVFSPAPPLPEPGAESPSPSAVDSTKPGRAATPTGGGRSAAPTGGAAGLPSGEPSPPGPGGAGCPGGCGLTETRVPGPGRAAAPMRRRLRRAGGRGVRSGTLCRARGWGTRVGGLWCRVARRWRRPLDGWCARTGTRSRAGRRDTRISRPPGRLRRCPAAGRDGHRTRRAGGRERTASREFGRPRLWRAGQADRAPREFGANPCPRRPQLPRRLPGARVPGRLRRASHVAPRRRRLRDRADCSRLPAHRLAPPQRAHLRARVSALPRRRDPARGGRRQVPRTTRACRVRSALCRLRRRHGAAHDARRRTARAALPHRRRLTRVQRHPYGDPRRHPR